MSHFMHALIMAAGRGLRMMPLTDVIPKPMAPYQGATLIANGINQIRPHIPNIHITVGYKGAALAQHVIGYGVSSVFNTSGKGNAWWIYNTLMKYINEPVVVLTCDNVVELKYDQLAEEYRRFKDPACMLVPVKPVPGLEGDFIFHEDHLVNKLDRHEPSDIYCSGIQVLNPFKINMLTNEKDDFLCVWNELIEKKEVYCSAVYPEKWFAVDTIEHLNKLNGLG